MAFLHTRLLINVKFFLSWCQEVYCSRPHPLRPHRHTRPVPTKVTLLQSWHFSYVDTQKRFFALSFKFEKSRKKVHYVLFQVVPKTLHGNIHENILHLWTILINCSAIRILYNNYIACNISRFFRYGSTSLIAN